MSRPQLIRSLGAPPELIDADLVDQLADASDSLERLRSNRPDGPSAAWDRDFARAQAAYLRALASLQKHRKAVPAAGPAPLAASDPQPSLADRPDPHNRLNPVETPPALGLPAAPAPTPAPAPSPPNRLDRRRLEAFKRASPERRRQMLASRPSG